MTPSKIKTKIIITATAKDALTLTDLSLLFSLEYSYDIFLGSSFFTCVIIYYNFSIHMVIFLDTAYF